MKGGITMNIQALWLVPCLVFAGCATIDWTNPGETEKRVRVTHAVLEKTIQYEGPDIGWGDTLRLRAWDSQSRKYNHDLQTMERNLTRYQIYVGDAYDGTWRFYHAAYDSDGNPLDTTLIARKVGYCSMHGCSKSEHVGVNVTRDYLDTHATSGVQFTLSGKAGNAVFFIPGGYIKGFLAAVPQ